MYADVPVRSARTFVILSIATLGTWWLWLLYRWAHEIDLARGMSRYRPWRVVAFTVLTLGVAGFWYHWQLARDLPMVGLVRGVPIPVDLGRRVGWLLVASALISFVSGGLALALSMVALGWASWLVQDALNRLARAPSASPAT